MQYINTFYISGLPGNLKPGLTQIKIRKSGLEIHKVFIDWRFVSDAEISYEVKESAVSAGKAVAGAVLAGGVGAVVGGMMGGKKVESYLRISYQTRNGTNSLLLAGNNSQRILKATQNRLQKHRKQIPSNTTSGQMSERKPAGKAFLYWYFALYRYSYKLLRRLWVSHKPTE